MNQQQARTALAVGNVVLTACVLGLGYVTLCPAQLLPEKIAKWREPPADSSVPDFKPLRLKLDDKPASSNPFQDYEVVWKQVDKPPPPPPPPEPPKPTGPTKEDLTTKFRLTLVALAADKSSANYAILDPKAGGESLVITANEQLPHPFEMYKCLTIDEIKDGNDKVCVVMLEDAAHSKSPIRLKVERVE
jgi:hypothetical protein